MANESGNGFEEGGADFEDQGRMIRKNERSK